LVNAWRDPDSNRGHHDFETPETGRRNDCADERLKCRRHIVGRGQIGIVKEYVAGRVGRRRKHFYLIYREQKRGVDAKLGR